jgi:starch synthase
MIRHALLRTLELGGQFVLLGTAPTQELHDDFYKLKIFYNGNSNVHIELEHHENIAHLIFAAADMFIMPSLFEPCGLTQLIAMRYGAVPIVRKTGGLADTVFDIDYSDKPLSQRNGYVFEYPDALGVDSALDRAFRDWSNDEEKWKNVVLNGLRMDFSWAASAQEYLKIYERLSKITSHLSA